MRITTKEVEETYSMSPKDMGLKMAKHLTQIRTLEATIALLKKEDTVLSRDVIEELEEEIRKKAAKVFLIQNRIQGEKKKNLLNKVSQ